MTDQVLTVIPARYASTRFPGKPLADIDGKPMIRHVWERAREVRGLDRVIVATDDVRIAEAVRAFGGEVRMTSPDHPSGTDRMWEVATQEPDYDWVLNIQGDEPFLDPAALEAALAARNPRTEIITLVAPIHDENDYQNPNVVKAVLAADGRALYFSRSAVPHVRDRQAGGPLEHVFRHIGIYLYRRVALERFVQLPPSPLEKLEKLEQLRALEAGMTIQAVAVDRAAQGVDTPEDLAALCERRP